MSIRNHSNPYFSPDDSEVNRADFDKEESIAANPYASPVNTATHNTTSQLDDLIGDCNPYNSPITPILDKFHFKPINYNNSDNLNKDSIIISNVDLADGEDSLNDEMNDFNDLYFIDGNTSGVYDDLLSRADSNPYNSPFPLRHSSNRSYKVSPDLSICNANSLSYNANSTPVLARQMKASEEDNSQNVVLASENPYSSPRNSFTLSFEGDSNIELLDYPFKESFSNLNPYGTPQMQTTSPEAAAMISSKASSVSPSISPVLLNRLASGGESPNRAENQREIKDFTCNLDTISSPKFSIHSTLTINKEVSSSIRSLLLQLIQQIFIFIQDLYLISIKYIKSIALSAVQFIWRILTFPFRIFLKISAWVWSLGLVILLKILRKAKSTLNRSDAALDSIISLCCRYSNGKSH